MNSLARLSLLLLLSLGLWAQPQQTAPTSQGYRIAGVLVNSLTGQPVAGASVAIAPANNEESDRINQTVLTAANGRFLFSNLRQGKYSLMAAARGSSLQYFEHHDIFATAIAVGPDLDSEHLVFRLDPDAAVDGNITDENGDPVQNAQVRLFQRNVSDAQGRTVPVEQGQSDDQGHFHIGHLAAGTYYVAVLARPWYAQNNRFRMHRGFAPSGVGAQAAQDAAALDMTYPLTFYPDAPDSEGASPVVLHAGERATADVVLRAVPSLHLRIHTGNPSNDGSPSRLIVPAVFQRSFDGYLESAFNAPVSWVEPGVVEISGLPPGHYVIEMPPDNGSKEKGASRGWYQEIDLVGDMEITATDTSGYPAVSGIITFSGVPRTPPGAAIELSNKETGETSRSEISSRGVFAFQSNAIRPGRYTLLLEAPQHFFLSHLTVSGARLTGRTLEITGAGRVQITGTAARGTATVKGAALRNDQPVAGSMIVLVPQDAGNNAPLFRRDQSDSDGTFTLSNVLPGRYTLLALSNGWNLEWSNPVVLQPYLKGGVPVEVTGDGEMQLKVPVQ